MGLPTWASGLLLLAILVPSCGGQKLTDESVAQDWLTDFNLRAMRVYYNATLAVWNYVTNLTDYNKKLSTEGRLARSLFLNQAAKNTSMFDWQNFQNSTIKRQFSKLAIANTANLPEDKINKLNQLRADMQKIYSTGQVCNKPGVRDKTKCYSLDPDLTRMLAGSRDYDELLQVWKGWRDATGRKMKDMYEEFVELQNEASKLDGFTDQGAYWRSWYETPTFEQDIEALWAKVKPMYQQLHAYVRRKLMDTYKGKDFPSGKQIPAHLLGNMWAQSWNNIEPLIRPFKNKTATDVTAKLVEQGYDAKRMFKTAEEFFTSLGLLPMPATFWNGSMIEKPNNRKVVCPGSAWDFYNQKDFRVKLCTDITFEHLVTVHHEMGHTEYELLYKHQPVVFREGANPGFHEAVGDVMSLSVATPEHLHKIGLLDMVESDTEADLNFLMSQALEKVAFLPFAYLVDQWRWAVFRGDTKKDAYTTDWWKLRCKYQGIAPPVLRSESDFDPGAKYHIPKNTPYIRYFVSFILQFQIQQALCETAGNTAPLHRCDIYKSKAAGTKLSEMLKLGASQKWPDALEKVTNTRKMDAQPMLDYFKPLMDWLKEQNKGQKVGWDEKCPEGTIVNSPADSALPSRVALVCGVVAAALAKVLYH